MRACGVRLLNRTRCPACGIRSRLRRAWRHGGGTTSAPAVAEEASRRVCNKACTIPSVPGNAVDEFTDALQAFGALATCTEDMQGPEAPVTDSSPPTPLAPGEPEADAGTEAPGRDAVASAASDAQLSKNRIWLPTQWSQCTVTALFEVDQTEADIKAAVQRSAAAAGMHECLDTVLTEVPEDDWIQKVKESFVPLKLSERLWIIPDWSPPVAQNAFNLKLTPGLAFGSGEHETTRMCLHWLEEALLEDCAVLDYGCGSGVLGVAASLMGARYVAAVDIDPVAVRAAQRNAELNKVQQYMEVFQAGAEEPLAANGARVQGGFDVVVANILKPALLELAPRLTSYVRPGGSIVLSGMLENQVQDVADVYVEHFEEMEAVVLEDWGMIYAIKRIDVPYPVADKRLDASDVYEEYK